MALVFASGARADVDVSLARAERPLNGPWAFRLGDDPTWSSPTLDDSQWERVDLTPAPDAHDGDVGLPGYVPGWTARGHRGRWGHAWYRLHLRFNVTSGGAPVLLGPTLVDSAYEVFWNGRRIGGIGDFGAAPPRMYGIRPQRFHLEEAASSGEGVLAIHVYLPQASLEDPEAGGMHVAPILAERGAGEARFIVQWWQTFWGYVADLVEPLALAVLGIYALSLRRDAMPDPFLAPAAGAAFAIAASRINQPLFFWTGLESLDTVLFVRYVLFNPLATALWVIACRRLAETKDRRIDLAICALGLLAAISAYPGLHLKHLHSAAMLMLLGLFIWSLVLVAVRGSGRLLALLTMLAFGCAVFADELGMIGIPGIWFPFGVGVSRTQFALAAALPLTAIFLHVRASAALRRHRAEIP